MSIFLLFLFLVYPFGAFLLAMYCLSIRKMEKVSILIIVLFAGLLGYTFLPAHTMDITRHYAMFEKMKSAYSISDFIFYESVSEKPDFFLDWVYWIVGQYVVDTHQIVGFLGAACYYGLGLGVILHWRRLLKSSSSFNNFFLLIGLFLSLIPVQEFNGMRQGNAIMLFLFIITIPDEDICGIKRFLLLIFPCLIHFSLYPIVALYIFVYFFKRKDCFVLSSVFLIGYLFFLPCMDAFKKLCLNFGSIGIGIATKIDDYLFQGDISAALYAGSVLRFILILILLFLFPLVFCAMENMGKWRKESSSFILRFHYFSLLFFSYVIFSSSSYILSRNLMLFKFMAVLYFSYVVFSSPIKRNLRKFLYCICLLVFFSGPFSLYFGKEYLTINTPIFYSSLFEILHLKTVPEGYYR